MNHVNSKATWSVWRAIATVFLQWNLRHTGLALLMGTVTTLYMGNFLNQLEGWKRYEFMLVVWLYHISQFGFPLVFAVQLADSTVDAGRHRILVYSLAVVFTVSIGVWVIGPLLSPLLTPFLMSTLSLAPSNFKWSWSSDFFLAFGVTLPLALTVAVYANWRQEQLSLARLRASEVEQAHQRQALRATGLLALQAHVDPKLLFDVLQRVNELIGISVPAADTLLADLIAMLRAMLPVAGANASTVEREFRLVETYARVTGSLALQPPQLSLDATAEAAAANFSPMVLLPTVRQLVVAMPVAWCVEAERIADRLRISLFLLSPDQSTKTALQALDQSVLRERLLDLYGETASVIFILKKKTGIAIELPYHNEYSLDRRHIRGARRDE